MMGLDYDTTLTSSLTLAHPWLPPPIPTYTLPPLILLVQATLAILPPSASLYTVRVLLTLPSVYLINWAMYTSHFEPVHDFVIFNTVIQIARTWSTLKSLEFGLVGKRYEWVGYGGKLGKGEAEGESVNGYDEDDKVKKRWEDPRHPHGPYQTLFYAWSIISNLRGIGWNYQQIPKANTAQSTKTLPPRQSTTSILMTLLFRIAWTQALTIIGLLFLVLSKQAAGPVHLQHPSKILLQQWLPLSPHTPLQDKLFEIIARSLYILCFGICVYTTLECGYSILALQTLLIQACLFPNSIDIRAWPVLMGRPYAATSLHQFWTKGWHALFSRPFKVIGYIPAKRVVGWAIGHRESDWARAAGVLAVFSLSGWMHESFNQATPWTPRDPHYRSFQFFTLQAIGIILESIFTTFTGRKVQSGWGRLWTFAWLLSTGSLMGDTWMDRGFADFMPPLDTWEWWRFVVPFALIFPRLSK